MEGKQVSETIREIRSFYLPNFLGIHKVTQTQFGQIVAGVAKEVLDADMLCPIATIQAWEYGLHVPGGIAIKAIQVIYNKTKDCTEPQGDEFRRIRCRFNDDDLSKFVQKITN